MLCSLAPPRTRSRRSGATSWMNRCIDTGSSPITMNVDTPSSSAIGSSSSTHCAGGPTSNPPFAILEGTADIQQPPDLARIPPDRHRRVIDDRVALRVAAGLRSAAATAAIRPLAADQAQHPRLERPDPDGDGMRCSRSALGPIHPVVRSTRASAPARWTRSPGSRRSPLPAHPRLRPATAASRPSHRSHPRTLRRRARARAARPSRRSRLTAARASTAGWRSGRLSTLPARWMRSVQSRGPRQQRPRVEEPRLVRVVLVGREVVPEPLAELGQQHRLLGVGVEGVMKVPNARAWP